jgi:hypothetical protein
MNRMFFGDTFIEIKRYLLPVDLYKLSLLCKTYNRMINKNMIENSMVSEIKHRIRLYLGTDYEKIMELLKPMEPTIIGSFIAQCILCETWQDCCVKIYVSKPSINLQNLFFDYPETTAIANDCDFIKFMSAKKYKMEHVRFFRYGGRRHINASIVRCNINGNNIDLLISKGDIGSAMHQHNEHNIYKNMYNITSDQLIIYNVDDIFSKRTNLVEYSNFCDNYLTMQKRGFKFYKSNQSNGKLLTNEEIIQYYQSLDIIKVKCIDDTYKQYLNTHHEFIIDGDKIYHMTRSIKYSDNDPVFTINHMLLRNDSKNINVYRHLRMYRCMSVDCVVKLIYPESEHYHCTYVTDEKKYDVEGYEDDDAFLILN